MQTYPSNLTESQYRTILNIIGDKCKRNHSLKDIFDGIFEEINDILRDTIRKKDGRNLNSFKLCDRFCVYFLSIYKRIIYNRNSSIQSHSFSKKTKNKNDVDNMLIHNTVYFMWK